MTNFLNNLIGIAHLIRELFARSVYLLIPRYYINLIAYLEVLFAAVLIRLLLLALLGLRSLLLGLFLNLLEIASIFTGFFVRFLGLSAYRRLRR